MNRRYIITLLSFLPLLTGLTACSSDDDASSKVGAELLNVEREVALAATETGASAKIVADCAWTVTDINKSGWDNLVISPLSGQGSSTLSITSEANHSSVDRTATLTIATEGGLKQKVTIHQTKSGADLKISQDTFEFSDAAGTQTLKVSCNTTWKIDGITGIDWLTVDQASGNGDAEVAISVKDTFDDADRAALLTVSAGSLGDNSFDIFVTQKGMALITLALSPTGELSFDAAGGTQKVTVTSNAAWQAAIPASVQDWLHITPASGIGDGEITITCDPHSSSQERLSVLTVTAGTQSPQRGSVVITQKSGN